MELEFLAPFSPEAQSDIGLRKALCESWSRNGMRPNYTPRPECQGSYSHKTLEFGPASGLYGILDELKNIPADIVDRVKSHPVRAAGEIAIFGPAASAVQTKLERWFGW